MNPHIVTCYQARQYFKSESHVKGDSCITVVQTGQIRQNIKNDDESLGLSIHLPLLNYHLRTSPMPHLL